MSESPGRYSFSQPLSLRVGEVVLTEEAVFKVVSLQVDGGRTIAVGTEPDLAELFQSFRIVGNFSAESRKTQKSATRPSDFLEPVEFSIGSQEKIGNTLFSSNLAGKVSAFADYEFDAARGGVVRATLEVFPDITLTSSIDVKAQKEESKRVQIGSVRIPIPVSIVDGVLNLVGVRLASISVPLYVGGSAEAKFEAGVTSAATAKGSLKLAFSQTEGTTVTNNITGTFTANFTAPVTPAGAQPLSTSSLRAGPSIGIRPALAFLNTVGLAGVDLSVNALGDAVLLAPIPGVQPSYCLSVTPLLTARAFGFFKAVGVEEVTTDAVEQTLFSGTTNSVGSCLIPTEVSAVAQPEGIYGTPLNMSVRVVGQPVSGVPAAAPSGKVRISLGSAMCDANLSASGPVSAQGTCALTPLKAGTPVQASLTYDGDQRYLASASTVSLNVAKAETITVASVSPERPSSGTRVTLKAAVTQRPAGNGNPTGTVRFSIDGTAACSASLSAISVAECDVFAPSRDFIVSAEYSGDENFKAGSSAPLTIEVGTQLPGMLGQNLTFARRWPTPDTPFLAWSPDSYTVTVVAGLADRRDWSGNLLVNPEETTIEFTVQQSSGYGDSAQSFDGIVISGFTKRIAAVAVNNQTRGTVSVRNTENTITIGLNSQNLPSTYFGAGAKFILTVTLE